MHPPSSAGERERACGSRLRPPKKQRCDKRKLSYVFHGAARTSATAYTCPCRHDRMATKQRTLAASGCCCWSACRLCVGQRERTAISPPPPPPPTSPPLTVGFLKDWCTLGDRLLRKPTALSCFPAGILAGKKRLQKANKKREGVQESIVSRFGLAVRR